MAIYAISALTDRVFVPGDQLDKDGERVPGASTFTVRPLDGVAHSEVMSLSEYDANKRTVSYSHRALMVAIAGGLTGWSNILNPETGDDLDYSPSVINRIPPVYIRQVAMEIISISELGVEQQKNS